MPNYQKLKTMVKRRKDQKFRLRNFDASHGRFESGAVVKSRKGIIGVEGGKGTCYQWKEKGQCSQGDRCSFRHETQDRAQKPRTHCRHTFWANQIVRSWKRWWRQETSIKKFGEALSVLRKEKRNQWKAKGQCSRGDQCSFQHDGDERVKSKPKTAPSSEPPTLRGRNASRKPQRHDSVWEDQSTAVQKLLERYSH